MTQEEAKKLIDKVNHRIKRIVNNLQLTKDEKSKLTEYNIFDHFPIKAETNSGNISMSKEVIAEVQNNEDLQQKLEDFTTLSNLKTESAERLAKANVDNITESDIKLEAVSAINVKYYEAKAKEEDEYDWYEEIKKTVNYLETDMVREVQSNPDLRDVKERYESVWNDMNHKGKKTYTKITKWVSEMKEIADEVKKYNSKKQ